MSIRILGHRYIKKFEIHPSAQPAFSLYSKIDYQYLNIYKPVSLVEKLLNHQTISVTKEDSTAFVFSGFCNYFFDVENIPNTTILVEHQNLENKNIEYLAWVDVLRHIFSSKIEKKGQAQLMQHKDLIPIEIIKQLLGINKLTVAELSRLSSTPRQTLERNMKPFR